MSRDHAPPLTLSRRTALGALIGGATLAIPSLAFARETDKRLVVILLRGALDGLHAMPAHGDPAYIAARNGLALQAPGGADASLRLTSLFSLHPKLAALGRMYQAGEMLGAHAVATAYRERSHFDAQNVLETGARSPFGRNAGWLNAAMAALPAARKANRAELAVAMAQQAPLILRGAAPVATWSPSPLPDADTDTVARLMSLYERTDPGLAGAMKGAIAANAIAGEAGMMDGGRGGGGGGRAGRQVAPAAKAAAAFLKQPNGPVAAVIEVGGWDSHAAQGQENGQIATMLGLLDAGVATLQTELGALWKDTVVVIVTEFGRTVAANGNRGTDHGTGAAAFVCGGAVAGGRVLADWPGLAAGQLYEGRDLRPTLDLRALVKGVLGDHMGIPRAALDANVFPDSAAAAPLQGLIKA
jgi:uncharacterized protein (DUF1501 family)